MRPFGPLLALALALGPAIAQADDAGGPGALDAGAPAALDAGAPRPDAGAPLDAAAGDADAARLDAAVPDDAGVADASTTDLADAAVVDGSVEAAAAPPEHGAPTPPEELDTSLVIRSFAALAVLVLLIWLASHPLARRIEEAIGVRQVVTSGLVFVALGAAARHPAIDVLTPALLEDLAPLLHFALGWLGFVVGFQLDVRMLDRLPRGTALTVSVESAAPFVAVTLAFAAALLAFGEPIDDPVFVQNALTLGAAGSVSVIAQNVRAPLFRVDETVETTRLRIDLLDEVVPVAGLALLGAFFRPDWIAWRWELPGTVWLFLTVGLGVAVGLLVYVMARERASVGEFVAIVVGSVALGAGVAGYLYLSPVVICFLAGALLTNLPFESRTRIWDVLTSLERPTYYALLVVAGALWDFSDWRGFILIPLFVVARTVGSFAGHKIIERADGAEPTSRTVLRPIGAISLAIVISAQSMYRGHAISWIVTAVIGGAIVTEALVQLTSRVRRSRVPAEPAAPAEKKEEGA